MLRISKLKSLWNPLKTTVRHYPYPREFLQFLQNMPEVEITTLDNGLTIASECKRGPHACVGLFVDGGSRYESDFENGIAHFFEHVAFTTTRARTRERLLEQMNCTGAKFGCFTTREYCAYYAECLDEDLKLCVDILADCVFNNAYNHQDIEQQKPVVLEELATYDQNASDVMMDYLHASAYQGTPLAKTVLGLSTNLNNFNEGTICRYLCKFFIPTRTVLAASGAVDHCYLVDLAKTYLGHYDGIRCVDRSIYRYTGSEIRYRHDGLPYGNVALAFEGPSFCDSDKAYIDVAVSMIGGWDFSQFGGLNHGVPLARCASLGQLCDAYKGFAVYYKDGGLWGVRFLATAKQQEDMLFNIQDYLMKMILITTPNELRRAKTHAKTRLLSKKETLKASCMDIGKYTLYNEKHVPSLLDRICEIDRVNLEDFKKVIDGYVYDKCPVVSAVGPVEGLPEYTRIRAHTYWLRF